jgi:hypothetical protein
MDLAYPIEFVNGSIKTVTGTDLAVSRVFMRLSTVNGERPYIPDYGLPNYVFNRDVDFPRSIDDIISAIESNGGMITYAVS